MDIVPGRSSRNLGSWPPSLNRREFDDRVEMVAVDGFGGLRAATPATRSDRKDRIVIRWGPGQHKITGGAESK